MTSEIDRQTRRGFAARIGITALNLLAPGLGLLRVGDWRAGLMLLALPLLFVILFNLGFGHFPVTNHASAVFAGILALVGLVAVYAVPAVMTWRRSPVR